METTLFALLAASMIVPAFFAVRAANLIHAALWLGASLLATAAVYAMLGASFLAGVQVLVYVGGVITLMIFGIMITRRHDSLVAQAESLHRGRAAALSLGLFAVIAKAIHASEGLDAPLSPVPSANAPTLGRALVIDHVLAFETLSLLLLAAIVGAVVLARRRDPPEVPAPEATS